MLRPYPRPAESYIIHRAGTQHLYWPGVNPWAAGDQPLETIQLDHESEREVTHCLVIPSHLNVNKYYESRTPSLCTFASGRFVRLLFFCWALYEGWRCGDE